MSANNLLTLNDLRGELFVSKRTIARLISRGVIPSFRLPGGRRRYIRRSDLDQIVAEQARQAQAARPAVPMNSQIAAMVRRRPGTEASRV